jgi:aryl-alcohol dehydrogenase-like predicted oxidoreductase
VVQKRLEPIRDRVQRYEEFCAELGHDPSEVALAWLLHRPGLTAPIIGPRNPEQLASNLRALEIELGESEMCRLDEIFPGPGGPAPEAYAW